MKRRQNRKKKFLIFIWNYEFSWLLSVLMNYGFYLPFIAVIWSFWLGKKLLDLRINVNYGIKDFMIEVFVGFIMTIGTKVDRK